MSKTITGYKFVTDSLKSKNGDCDWEVGVWKEHEGYNIRMCETGFHASESALDSLQYNYGNRWFTVEARGDIEHDTNKFVASEMRLMNELDVKAIVVKFAILCARRSLHFFEDKYPKDDRPRKAIEAAEEYLKNPTKSAARSARSAAESAAESAWSAAESAWSAAESAWSAARSAAESARSAARSAAESAARSAAESARSAAESAAESARSAEIKWQKETLQSLIDESLKVKA